MEELMRHRLFSSVANGVTEFFRWSDSCIAQALREEGDRRSLVGAVFSGQIKHLDHALGAAFVDIGLERPGLLPLKKGKPRPNEGEWIVAEIRRDSWEEKGPRLSLKPSEWAKEIARDAKTDGKKIAMLAPPPPLWARAIADLAPGEIGEIVCSRPVDSSAIMQWAAVHRPILVERVRVLPVVHWEFSRDQALDEIALALEEKVWLREGGTLLFEPVRTLTAIDVNSGGSDRSAFDINCSAALEIPRQLSLRNIGGQIVVDFIDLKDKDRRNHIVDLLRKSSLIDPGIGWVGAMSRLGLIEMQRRRLGTTLAEMWKDVISGADS